MYLQHYTQCQTKVHRVSDNTGTKHFIVVVPDGELAWGDAALRCVEEEVEAVVAHYQGCILERLTVTDADAVATHLAGSHG